MRKVLGLTMLLLLLIGVICLLEYGRRREILFLTAPNLRNLLLWIGLYGILSLGQAFVIITGGIDLSVGSILALVGVCVAMLLPRFAQVGIPPSATIALVLLMATAIGAWHGLLVTKGSMQPFVVTLCGLFFYRGIARFIAGDITQGFGTSYTGWKWLGQGYIPNENSLIPVAFVIFVVLSIIVAAYLHLTAQGRHIFALGANEEAARYSGINTSRLKLLAYSMCGLLTGIGGLLLAFKVNSVGPSNFGSSYELYAIAGVVLGGCSLRGGSGNVLGVMVGAALIRVLENMVNILNIRSELTYVVIGGAILVGVFLDELWTRRQMRVRIAH